MIFELPSSIFAKENGGFLIIQLLSQSQLIGMQHLWNIPPFYKISSAEE
jgi:hypothetical protein